MSEIELKKLLTELYKTAEAIGKIGIHDVTSSDYVRMWINDERKVLRMFKKQQTHLNLAVEALEVAKKAIMSDSGYGEANEIIYNALKQIKGE